MGSAQKNQVLSSTANVKGELLEVEPGFVGWLFQQPLHAQLGECREPGIHCQILPTSLRTIQGKILQDPEGSRNVCSPSEPRQGHKFRTESSRDSSVQCLGICCQSAIQQEGPPAFPPALVRQKHPHPHSCAKGDMRWAESSKHCSRCFSDGVLDKLKMLWRGIRHCHLPALFCCLVFLM